MWTGTACQNSQPMLCCGWQFLMGSRIPGCSWLWFFAVTKPMLVLSWRLNDDERQGTPGWAYCTVHIYIYIYISVRQMLKTASKNCQGKNLWQVGTATLCCVFWICLDPSPNTPPVAVLTGTATFVSSLLMSTILPLSMIDSCLHSKLLIKFLIFSFAFWLPLFPARAAVGTTFVQIGLVLISTWVTSSKLYCNGCADVQMYIHIHAHHIHMSQIPTAERHM